MIGFFIVIYELLMNNISRHLMDILFINIMADHDVD